MGLDRPQRLNEFLPLLSRKEVVLRDEREWTISVVPVSAALERTELIPGFSAIEGLEDEPIAVLVEDRGVRLSPDERISGPLDHSDAGELMEKVGEIVETADHGFWGKIQRRSGYEGWDSEIEAEWPGKGTMKIRVDFEDPNDAIVQENYKKIRERWDSIWPRIVSRTEEMKARYGYQDTPTNGWVSLTPPKQPIEEQTEWSAMLQAEEAGWLLDFKGWEDFGGQGVF